MQFRSTVLAGAVGAALMSTSAFAGIYSNTYFFGDSLTDSGAFGGLGSLPAGSRWTTDNADNYATLIGKKYGVTVQATNDTAINNTLSVTGNNYAQGGAQAQNSSYTMDATGSATPILDLYEQVDLYLNRTGGKADSKALYTLWIGGNDVATAMTQGSPSTYITASGQAAAQQASRLQEAGAKHIVFLKAADFSITPAVLFAVVEGAVEGTLGGGADVKTGLAKTIYDGAIAQAQAALNAASGTNSQKFTNALNAAGSALDTAFSQSAGTFATAMTPQYAAAKAGAAQLSAGMNQALTGYLGAYGVNALIVPTDKLIAELVANPAQFGLANVTGPACLVTSTYNSLTCASTDPGFDTGVNHLFADDRHPTPEAHALVAEAVASFLDAPYNAAPLANTGMATLSSRISVIDGRMAIERPKGEVQAFAAMSYQQHNQDAANGLTGLDGTGSSVTVGVDSRMTDKLTAGFAATAQNTKADYSNGGGFRANDLLLGFFINYQDGYYRAQVDTFLGQTRFTDINRKVTLGSTTRTETGSTTGGQVGLRFTAAYDYEFAGIKTGPQASLLMREAQVYAFTESGTSSTAAAYGEQKIRNLRSGLGWQLSADFGAIKPSASIMGYYDAKDKTRSMLVTSSGSSSYAQIDLAAPDNRYTEVQVGASWGLAKGLNLTADVRATLQLENETRRQANIGVNYAY